MAIPGLRTDEDCRRAQVCLQARLFAPDDSLLRIFHQEPGPNKYFQRKQLLNTILTPPPQKKPLPSIAYASRNLPITSLALKQGMAILYPISHLICVKILPWSFDSLLRMLQAYVSGMKEDLAM